MKLYCEGCKRPASKARWEFKSDPTGRLCVSCVAAGVDPAKPRRVRVSLDGGPRVYSKQGNSVYKLDAGVMRLLAAAHAARLRGELQPLTEPDELSIYNPTGRSCMRGADECRRPSVP